MNKIAFIFFITLIHGFVCANNEFLGTIIKYYSDSKSNLFSRLVQPYRQYLDIREKIEIASKKNILLMHQREQYLKLHKKNNKELEISLHGCWFIWILGLYLFYNAQNK